MFNLPDQIESLKTGAFVKFPSAVSWLNVTTMQVAALSLPDEHNADKISNDAANIDSNFTKLENEQSQEHEASFQVDSSLLRFIVGPGGVIKAKIENDCGAVLHIPSKSSSAKFASNIIVRGPTMHDVNGAVRQIQEVVEQAVKSTNYQYTHFISLPLAVHESLVKELVSFEEAVLAAVRGSYEHVSGHEDDVHGQGEEEEEEEADKAAGALTQMRKHNMGIDESIFVKAKTFHLTVLMLKLWNQDRIDAAVDILQVCLEIERSLEDLETYLSLLLFQPSCRGCFAPSTCSVRSCLQRTREAVSLALEKRPLEIELKGAECMKSNPAKAHVLYARVQEVDQGTRLMSACQILVDAFVAGGLVMERDQKQPLMLHATLMNTSHRKRARGKGRSFRRIPFDARQIITTYGVKDWGKYLITQVHLSQRFHYDDDGYYHCCTSISLPAP